jgi:hypothetical protein
MPRRMFEFTDRENNQTLIDLNDIVVISYRKYAGQEPETVIVMSSGYQLSVIEAYQEVSNLVQKEK